MSTWTQAFANAGRTSAVTEGPSLAALDPLWYTPFAAYIHQYVQPITDGTDIYVATSAGLHKIDASDGSVIWSYPGRYGCTPAYAGGYVYAARMDGLIVKLNATTGALSASLSTNGPGFTSDILVASDGSIITGNRAGLVYCWAGAAPARWTYQTGGMIDAPCAEDAGVVYVASCDGHVYALDLDDGTELADSGLLYGDGFHQFGPVVDSGRGQVYIPMCAPVDKSVAAGGWSAIYEKPGGGITTSWRSREEVALYNKANASDTLPAGIRVADSSIASSDVFFPDGMEVLDFSVQNTDQEVRTGEYITEPQAYCNAGSGNEERSMMLVLDAGDLTEVLVGGERVFFGHTGTRSGPRYGCAIDAGGNVWTSNVRGGWDGQTLVIPRGAVMLWDGGTRFGLTEMTFATDEPLTYSIGNGVLHGALCFWRSFESFALSAPDTLVTHAGYQDGIATTTEALADGINAYYGDAADLALVTSGAYGGRDGTYGADGFIGMPVPAGSYVYQIVANTLCCWGVGSFGAAATEVAAVTDTTPATRSIDAVAEIEAAIEGLFSGATPLHLRPGLRYHGIPEQRLWRSGADDMRALGRYGVWAHELLIPLLRAYPYVDAAHQAQIAGYVASEWASYGPGGNISLSPLAAGTARNHAPPPADASLPNDSAWQEFYPVATPVHPWLTHPMWWYLAWQMVDVLGEDASTLYTLLSGKSTYVSDRAALLAGTYAGRWTVRREALNAHMAGLYGRWLLEIEVLGATHATTLETKGLLDDLVTEWNTLLDTATVYTTSDVAQRRNTNAFHQWLWLVPEVAALIKADAGYSQTTVNAVLAQQDALTAFWDTRDYLPMIGEGQFVPHYTYPALFNAKTLFSATAPDQDAMGRYLDAPVWARGDHDYIDALAVYLTLDEGEPPPPEPPDPTEETTEPPPRRRPPAYAAPVPETSTGIQIDILDAAGNRCGAGPLLSATGWTATPRLSQAGTFAFQVPAADPLAAELTPRRRVQFWSVEAGVRIDRGGGVIDSRRIQRGAPTMLEISGGDLLRELTWRQTAGLQLTQLETDDPDHAQEYTAGVSTEWSSYPQTHQMDADAGDYVYLAYTDRFDQVALTLDATTKNNNAATLRAQAPILQEGSITWVEVPITDGTAVGGATLAQSGVIEISAPEEWALYDNEQAGGDFYWVRLFPSANLDTVEFEGVTIQWYGPTDTALADVMAYAPAGWSVRDDVENSCYTTTENAVYLPEPGRNVLECLCKIAEVTGENFRLGEGRVLEWLRTDTPASGVRAVDAPLPLTLFDGIAQIKNLARTQDSFELCSRVYPFGGGQGVARVTLAQTTRSAPTGYTLDAAANYIKRDATEDDYLGRVDRVIENTTIVAQSAADAQAVYAADALFDWALAELTRTSATSDADLPTEYDMELVQLNGVIRPGETVDVLYREIVDGTLLWEVNGAVVVLAPEIQMGTDGLRTLRLTLGQWIRDDATLLVQNLNKTADMRTVKQPESGLIDNSTGVSVATTIKDGKITATRKVAGITGNWDTNADYKLTFIGGVLVDAEDISA